MLCAAFLLFHVCTALLDFCLLPFAFFFCLFLWAARLRSCIELMVVVFLKFCFGRPDTYFVGACTNPNHQRTLPTHFYIHRNTRHSALASTSCQCQVLTKVLTKVLATRAIRKSRYHAITRLARALRALQPSTKGTRRRATTGTCTRVCALQTVTTAGYAQRQTHARKLRARPAKVQGRVHGRVQ